MNRSKKRANDYKRAFWGSLLRARCSRRPSTTTQFPQNPGGSRTLPCLGTSFFILRVWLCGRRALEGKGAGGSRQRAKTAAAVACFGGGAGGLLTTSIITCMVALRHVSRVLLLLTQSIAVAHSALCAERALRHSQQPGQGLRRRTPQTRRASYSFL